MLSRSLRRAAFHSPQRPSLTPRQGCRRLQSSSSKPPAPVQQDPTHPSPLHEHFIQQTTVAIDFFGRFLKFSAIGLVTVSITTWTAFECAHQYVECAEMAPEQDEEVRRWQWDLEAEKWTGGASGGTDPALGMVGRHLIRAAWMAQNWGTGSNSSAIASNASSGRGAGGLNIVEARLEYAQEFLRTALNIAEQRMESGKLKPQTIGDLLSRHANVMERMGTRDALVEARLEYERIWASQPGKGVLAARTALKLGDINSQLGDKEDALAWWVRTFQLLQGKASAAEPGTSLIPESIPSEPLAQRTFISTLISLSAFHAMSGQLRQAQAVEETSLNLLRTIPQPQSLNDASPPQALHALYILHRSSLLSIHLAEVLYALRNKPVASIEWLTRAAESAERVALTLTGLPSVHPDAPQSKIPHPPAPETPLVPAYSKSVSMSRPARGLLRDSRRTAAEAWSLIGVLTETSSAPGAKERAVECYERALGWAGVGADGPGGIGKAGEGMLESEWKVLWSNYVRARDAVLTQAKK
ncbi:hypothetical protein PHLGIDRAFT_69796 [Phlebiopsis gigantea 11061_1 CR5-6]|uniref:Uncharacterized protein n=1 Tax=Phlebiopsis gigantea (strain 11061_1 CR5-6) TaxID=745531 RepID=A0A0C3S9D0_PHLG1|nr:hypothetical protein PHLGIDRAFT_69796 [Phlebiopsis gigantea 11061_1 CR5-6]